MNIDSENFTKPNINNNKDNSDIDLMALMLVLLRGWKTVLFFALLGLAIGILYSRYVNPTFKADALLQIEENSQGLSALGQDITSLVGSTSSTADTEAELIKSRMILKPVVDLLNLRLRLSDPAVNYVSRIKSSYIDTQRNTTENVSLNTEDGKAIVSKFNVSPNYLNKTFKLTRSDTGFILSNGFDDFKGKFNEPYLFKGSDGQIQINVSDLPMNAHTVNISKRSLKPITDSLNGSLSVVEVGKQTGIMQLSMTGSNQEQVTEILNQITLSYVAQNQSRGSEETTKTLEFMETQIPILKNRLEDSEAAFNKFREQSGTINIEQEAGILVSEKSQIDVQINDLKLKKADLTTYYTEEHPLVIQINDQLKVLNARKQEIDTTVAGLPEIQREFLQLSEDTSINREVYLALLKNYEQLKIVKAGQIGHARIIDLPISTFNAIAPKKRMIWLLALLLGTILGSILVLLRSLTRNVVKDPELIETKTGIPVLATIPRSSLLARLDKNKKSSNRLLSYTDNNSLSYEAIKSLRTNLIFSMGNQSKSGERAKVILITGESPGVGKSFITSNLAEVFSQLDKKILIIDADMRLGELHKLFNTEVDNGLADYFTQKDESIVNIVHPTNIDNIDFIPRGKHLRNPNALLSSDKFAGLIKQLSLHYDYIIMDSPPVLAASDAAVIAQYADIVLMVTRYGKSIQGQLSYAVKQLHRANAQVDGIVLNDMQQGRTDRYSYHYTYTYGNSINK